MIPPSRQPSALERLRALEAQEAAQRAQAAGVAEPAPSRSRWGAAGGVGALALLLWKAKSLLGFAVGVLAKGAKALPTMWTMVLAAWAYALFFGWPFAVGLVLLVLIHELGHGAAARAVGLPVGVPIFIPFMGAMISLKERPRSTWQESVVAAGGPLIGGLAALACVGLSFLPATGTLQPLVRVVGYYGLVINLFNLLPFWQLDGARILAPVRPVPGLVGALAVLVLTALLGLQLGRVEPLGILAAVLATFQLGRRAWRAHRASAPSGALARLERLEQADRASPDGDADVQPGQRLIALGTWVLLTGGLTVLASLVRPWLPRLGP